ncbi:MAG: transcription termination/antitermination protein NusA [Chloroflexi bacterium]|nr:transcription termination/antitermination protein NusA [Chloroflexota bacterium]
MKNEFVLAFNEVLEEKGLPKEVILHALESAMVSAYRRSVNASNAQQIEAKIDLDTGKVTIYADKEVVEQVEDPRTEVSLAEARRYDPDAELGQMVVVESTPRDFGRVAAQTARQVIQQRIRDAERQAQLAYYEKQVGEIISGIVQAVNAQGLTVGLEMRAEGSMPRKEMIPGERFRVHDRVRALLAEVKDSSRGPQIILSRTHRNFLRRLLENEVPEIYHGIVEIRSIAREPGERAKVAVYAQQQGIDPVGACVGIRGVRIQAIVRELHDEKIDVIEWNPDPAVYIAKALSPARVLGVYLNEKNSGGKTATVVVPEDQLSLAIGRDGQNARLAAKLTSWRIDIKSLPEATADVVYRLETDPAYAQVLEVEKDRLEGIQELLAKKAENRPLTPEEYDRMMQFVDRVEKRVAVKQAPEKRTEEDEKTLAVRRTVAPSAFEINIIDSDLPEHVAYTLQENGYNTVGDLAVQMKLDADQILRLPGIGPRALNEIQRLTQAYNVEPVEVEVEAEGEPEAEAEVETAPEAQVVEPAEAVEAVPEQEEAEETVEPAEFQAAAEAPAAESAEAQAVEPAAAGEAAAEDENEDVSFDELFTLRPEVIDDIPLDEEEEEAPPQPKVKKKGKKARKSKNIEIEYDPEVGQTIARKKHKRGGSDIWGDW